MRNNNFLQVDCIKVSSELLNDKHIFESTLKDFLEQPIVLKDKRRNPIYYEVFKHRIGTVQDDFVKNIHSIVRYIKYKQN